MNELNFNWEWTKIQLIVNLNLIKNELKVKWKWTKSYLKWIKI
jgi:hypothetical protein